MNLKDFKAALRANTEKVIQFALPTGTRIPLHAHVTDVARIEKKFVDCGGTFRTEAHCSLQAWFSDDTDHRIGAKTLEKILDKAAPFLESEELEVEVEYEAPYISKFPVSEAVVESGILIFRLGTRHTTCLAPDVCIPASKANTLLFKPLPELRASKCC
jgi:hypothetical protein